MSDPREARDALDARLQRQERLVPPFGDDAGLEPPAELDQIVVARARRALRDDRAAETGPSRTWLPSWGVPVAIAATFVLSFALALQMSGIEDVQREVAVLQPPAAAPAGPPAALPDAGPSAAPPPDVRDDPDRWLRDISELRADGQLDAARRELLAFAARHPTHAVPPDLADLLPR